MTKSRTLRKAGAVVLSLAMAFSVAGVAPSADAAAKKPALSAKKGTITVGNKKTVKVKNTKAKKVKNLVVSSNKTAVATVKKNSKVKFTVTGKKAGTAKITAKVTLKKKVAKKKVFTLKYTATVKAAATPTEEPTIAPTEEPAKAITLADNDGLQADGTAAVGDKLEVSYGADLGTPKNISWYVDDKVAQSKDFTSGTVTQAERQYTAVKGVVYAIIENTYGERIKSNSITVADELAATISDFDITEDLTTQDHIVYDTESNKLIVTAKLNKNYAGKFYLIEASKTTYKWSDTVNAAESTITTAGATAKTKAADFTDAKATAAGIKFVNDDKTISYKFVVPGAVKRGTAYKLIFDQTGVSSSKVTNVAYTDGSDGQTTNAPIITDAVTVKYLPAPASIKLTKKVANQAPEITIYGADTKALSWFGNNTAISSLGVDAIGVYEETGTSKAKASSKAPALTSTAKEGVITSNTALSATGYSYYWATITFKAGIFDEKLITLESEISDKSTNIGTISGIESDSTTVSTAVVKLENVLDAGTVYVYNEDPSSFSDSEIVSKAKGSAAVVKGTSEAKITGVITKVGTYYAILVPTNTDSYIKVDGSGIIKSTPTTVKANKSNKVGVSIDTGDVVIKGLVAYDQFGDVCTAGTAAALTATVTAQNKVSTSPATYKASYEVNTAGDLTVNAKNRDTEDTIAEGDGFTVTLLGSTIKVVASGNTDTSGSGDVATLDVTLDGTKLTVENTRVATSLRTTAGVPVTSLTGAVANLFATSAATVTLASQVYVYDQYGDLYKTNDLAAIDVENIKDGTNGNNKETLILTVSTSTGELTAEMKMTAGDDGSTANPVTSVAFTLLGCKITVTEE